MADRNFIGIDGENRCSSEPPKSNSSFHGYFRHLCEIGTNQNPLDLRNDGFAQQQGWWRRERHGSPGQRSSSQIANLLSKQGEVDLFIAGELEQSVRFDALQHDYFSLNMILIRKRLGNLLLQFFLYYFSNWLFHIGKITQYFLWQVVTLQQVKEIDFPGFDSIYQICRIIDEEVIHLCQVHANQYVVQFFHNAMILSFSIQSIQAIPTPDIYFDSLFFRMSTMIFW